MNEETVGEIDRYISTLFGCEDAELAAAQARADDAGLPPIAVAPSQGKLLMLFVRMLRAERVLEVGTLGGYSTAWLARGLADGGSITTLEFEPKHAEVARRNLDELGVGDRVEIVVGPAAESLDRMIAAGEPPFDLVFLDADKQGYPGYLDQALRLSRPGTVLLADNVVRGGKVIDPAPEDTASVGAAEFNRLLAADPRVDAVIVPVFSRKGFDGIAVAVVDR